MSFKKLSKSTLLHIYGDKTELESKEIKVNITYLSSLPLIRYLWWRRLEVMLSKVIIKKHHYVLDLGSGEGVFLPSIYSLTNNLYASDIDVSIVSRLCKYLNLQKVKIIEDDILHTCLPLGKFDFIFASSVFEHINDLGILFRNISLLLKENGKLVFSIPSENALYKIGRIITFYNRFSNDVHTHHNNSEIILKKSNEYFDLEDKTYTPFNFSRISLHNIYVLVKKCENIKK